MDSVTCHDWRLGDTLKSAFDDSILSASFQGDAVPKNLIRCCLIEYSLVTLRYELTPQGLCLFKFFWCHVNVLLSIVDAF